MRTKRRRRLPAGTQWVIVCCVLLLTGRLGNPGRVAAQDREGIASGPPLFVDDASRMSTTRVAEVCDLLPDVAAAQRQLVQLLRRARREGLSIAIAGARHSMGGQTIAPGGIVVNMLPFQAMTLDPRARILHVQAGARWAQVIPYLDQRGLSVAVMQSDNPFTVGGSISVNCHGWQHGRPPIASTVQAFRLLRADGTVVRCSRDQNAQLFSLALGGYGLFGVIFDVDLRVVPNERYRMEYSVMPSDQYVATLDRVVRREPGVAMVYGRLGVVPGNFLKEASLTVFRRAPAPDGRIPPLGKPEHTALIRAIFRGSVGSDLGKTLRWWAEKAASKHDAGKFFSRNQLLNTGVEVYENRSAWSTDILHEYFIPPDHFGPFLERLRAIVPKHRGNLLNVTVRGVQRDDDTFLRYADRDLLALVMLFNVPRTPEGDARMEAMTREIIDAAEDLGGRYYLPYRLHAARKQFARGYPAARSFFELKRQYDPEAVFQNRFSRKYGPPDRHQCDE